MLSLISLAAYLQCSWPCIAFIYFLLLMCLNGHKQDLFLSKVAAQGNDGVPE